LIERRPARFMYAMDFSVNPRALAGLADALDLRAHNLAGAASYLRMHSNLRFGAGLINELAGTHDRLVAEITGFLRRAGTDHAERYSVAVHQAVRAYQTSDGQASARLDASLPGVIDPSVPAHLADQSLGPGIFDDPSCLTLATPPNYQAQYPYQPEWYDLLSPSSIPRDIIWQVTGALTKLGLCPEQIDVYEEITAPFCGDWAGLERVSFALTQVHRALFFVSGRLDEEASALERVWTGHAAGNCRSVLRRFAHDLRVAEDLVVAIAAEYHQVAVTAREQGEAMATMISMILDIASSFGIEFAVELGADALLDLPRLTRIGTALWRVLAQVRTMIEVLHLAIEGANSNLTDLCHRLGVLTAHPFVVDLPDDLPVLPVPAHR
jgi:uncharacterized protein YukE